VRQSDRARGPHEQGGREGGGGERDREREREREREHKGEKKPCESMYMGVRHQSCMVALVHLLC
jgi:hypothetical protein